MASLAEIRARLAASESKQGGQSTGGDNSIYPHWNMEEGYSLAAIPAAESRDPVLERFQQLAAIKCN